MRRSFARTMQDELASNENSVLLLGDIGVHSFKSSFDAFPNRVYNIGILEQSMVSVAAGMSLGGLIPTVHTIAPFIIERAFEQIKIDFGYQKLKGNIVTVGASIDYASLGCTHHCPGDVGILLNVPDVQIVVPGNGEEFSLLFNESSRNDSLTYSRLSEESNSSTQAVEFGKGIKIKEGGAVTVLCTGPTLDRTLEACMDLDVSILYFTTIFPFDHQILRSECSNGKLLVVEPFYKYSLAPLVAESLSGLPVRLDSVGIPREFLRNYGSSSQQYESMGLTSKAIRKSILDLIDA